MTIVEIATRIDDLDRTIEDLMEAIDKYTKERNELYEQWNAARKSKEGKKRIQDLKMKKTVLESQACAIARGGTYVECNSDDELAIIREEVEKLYKELEAYGAEDYL